MSLNCKKISDEAHNEIYVASTCEESPKNCPKMTVGHPNYLTLWLAVLGAGVLRHLWGLRPLNWKLHRSRILLVAPPQRFGRSPRFNLIAEQFQCKIRASEDNCRLILGRPTHHLVFVIPTLSLNRKSTLLEKMPFLHWSLILFRIWSTTYMQLCMVTFEIRASNSDR